MKFLGFILLGVALAAFAWPAIMPGTPKAAAVAPFMGVMAMALGGALVVADVITRKK